MKKYLSFGSIFLLILLLGLGIISCLSSGTPYRIFYILCWGLGISMIFSIVGLIYDIASLPSNTNFFWIGVIGVAVSASIFITAFMSYWDVPMHSRLNMLYADGIKSRADSGFFVFGTDIDTFFKEPYSIETIHNQCQTLRKNYHLETTIILTDIAEEDTANVVAGHYDIVFFINSSRKMMKVVVKDKWDKDIISEAEIRHIEALVQEAFNREDYYHGCLAGLQQIERDLQAYQQERDWLIAE